MPSVACDGAICLVRRDKLDTFGDQRLQLFIGQAAKLAWRPSFKLLRGLAETTIKERARRGYTRGFALTFIAYRCERLQRVIGELARSFSQFPLLLRRGDDDR